MHENFMESTIEKEAERIKKLQDIDLEKIENELSFSELTDNINFNEWKKDAIKDLENFEKTIKELTNI